MSKVDWEAELESQLDRHSVGTIALAGFMRILSPEFTARWSGRIVNIHPSLLPKYRGLDTHRRAIEAKDAVSGCSVHLVTAELDAGDVIAQAEVPVLADDTADSLEQRVLDAEHRLYPRALAEFVGR
jgi:phosphoribosylglycinamide formyltransferase-1